MGLILSIQPISQALAGVLIASAWQGIILAAMMGVCLKLAPRTSANLRFLLWMGVFVAIALLPFLSLSAPAGLTATVASEATINSGPAISLDSRWAWALAALWLVASFTRAIGLMRNGLRLRAVSRSSTPIDVCAELKQTISAGGFRAAKLCTSPDVDQPCVIGFFAPRILIPEWLVAHTTPAELHQILLHESAHLRRLDDWTNLLQKLALVVFPLNSGLWWAEKRLCSEREAACDEHVISATQAPTQYATCLANLAEARMQRRILSLSLGAWGHHSELGSRIRGILSRDKKMSPLKARLVLAALALATATAALELGRSAQLVSFTGAPEPTPTMPTPTIPTHGNLRPEGHYREVVYRQTQQEASEKAFSASSVASRRDDVAQSGPPLQRKRMSAMKPVNDRPLRPQAVLLVTQWNGLDGQRVTAWTVIRRDVAVSSHTVVESQSGWYFIQL